MLFWSAFIWRIFLEKKNSTCCFLKVKWLMKRSCSKVLKLNIVIWRENLCAYENANFLLTGLLQHQHHPNLFNYRRHTGNTVEPQHILSVEQADHEGNPHAAATNNERPNLNSTNPWTDFFYLVSTALKYALINERYMFL